MQHDVDIVNHQITDYIHIQTSRTELAQAMNFKKQRSRQHRFERNHCRVEPFEVANLQDPSAAAGRIEQRLSRFYVGRDGLLDQHVQPGREQGATQLPVGLRWSRDNRSITVFNQF